VGSPRLAGIRQPGLHRAGAQIGGGVGVGASTADAITIADAGNYWTSGFVEGALQEAGAALALRPLLTDLAATTLGKGAALVGTHDGSLLIAGLHPTVEDSLVSIADDVNTNATAIALCPLTSDLASQAGGKGASTIGFQDAGSRYPPIYAGTVETALGYAGWQIGLHATAIAANTAAIALTPLTSDLASTTAGKGASTIALQDAGAYYATKNVEAALAQLGPHLAGTFALGVAKWLGVTLADAATTTQPDIEVLGHTSSGTTAAGFGYTVAGELQSAGGTKRRVMTDVLKLTTATNAAEVASRTISLMSAGALATAFTLTPAQVFLPGGSATAPAIATAGFPGTGHYLDTNNAWSVAVAGVNAYNFASATLGMSNPNAAISFYNVSVGRDPATGAVLVSSTIGMNVFSGYNTLAITPGKSVLTLTDATTSTAPEMSTLKHTTSGIAVAGFGALAAVYLHNAFPTVTPTAGSGVTTLAMTDVVTWTSPTNAAEASQRTISLVLGGTVTKVGGYGFNSSTYPMMFVGDPAAGDGFRRVTAGGRIDLMLGGVAYWAYGLTSECFGHVIVDGNHSVTGNVTVTARFLKHRGAGIASAATVTLGADGNAFAITGTTTVKGLVTSGWTAGTRVTLELVSGITINHNDATPGAGAVAILLRAAANLTTSAVYMLDLVYNGTNWIQPG
jgi:hypothetical protein